MASEGDGTVAHPASLAEELRAKHVSGEGIGYIQLAGAVFSLGSRK